MRERPNGYNDTDYMWLDLLDAAGWEHEATLDTERNELERQEVERAYQILENSSYTSETLKRINLTAVKQLVTNFDNTHLGYLRGFSHKDKYFMLCDVVNEKNAGEGLSLQQVLNDIERNRFGFDGIDHVIIPLAESGYFGLFNHFVFLDIDIKKNKITLFDPRGNVNRLYYIGDIKKKILSGPFKDYDFEAVYLDQQSAFDDHNCGPWTHANIMHFIKNGSLSRETKPLAHHRKNQISNYSGDEVEIEATVSGYIKNNKEKIALEFPEQVEIRGDQVVVKHEFRDEIRNQIKERIRLQDYVSKHLDPRFYVRHKKAIRIASYAVGALAIIAAGALVSTVVAVTAPVSVPVLAILGMGVMASAILGGLAGIAYLSYRLYKKYENKNEAHDQPQPYPIDGTTTPERRVSGFTHFHRPIVGELPSNPSNQDDFSANSDDEGEVFEQQTKLTSSTRQGISQNGLFAKEEYHGSQSKKGKEEATATSSPTHTPTSPRRNNS